MHAPPPSIEDVQVLLIQARSAPEMLEQEQQCFLERCRIRADQLAACNVINESLASAPLDEVDAILIGGAGEYSAQDDHSWTEDLHSFIQEAVEEDMPIFGSCWGHQVIARAFGGKVIYDPSRAEIGSGDVRLTEAGTQDLLFRSFPRQFKANMGHHDRVETLPPNAIELAFNDSQRNQAFRIRGKLVYGTQFHTELDAARERERLITYRKYYRDALPTEEAFQKVMNNLDETTEVDHLLYDFLRLCVDQT